MNFGMLLFIVWIYHSMEEDADAGCRDFIQSAIESGGIEIEENQPKQPVPVNEIIEILITRQFPFPFGSKGRRFFYLPSTCELQSIPVKAMLHIAEKYLTGGDIARAAAVNDVAFEIIKERVNHLKEAPFQRQVDPSTTKIRAQFKEDLELVQEQRMSIKKQSSWWPRELWQITRWNLRRVSQERDTYRTFQLRTTENTIVTLTSRSKQH